MGTEACDKHSYLKALQFFGLALEFASRSAMDFRFQVQCHLASCYFNLKEYSKALLAGKEAHRVRPGKSQVKEERVYNTSL